MAGVKNRSGRPGHKKELRHLEILMACETILFNSLKSPKVKDKEKRIIALELYKKAMPNKLEGNIQHTHTLEQVKNEYDDYLRKRNGNARDNRLPVETPSAN